MSYHFQTQRSTVHVYELVIQPGAPGGLGFADPVSVFARISAYPIN